MIEYMGSKRGQYRVPWSLVDAQIHGVMGYHKYGLRQSRL